MTQTYLSTASTVEPTNKLWKNVPAALSLDRLKICAGTKVLFRQNYCLVVSVPINALIVSIHAFWFSELLVCNNSLFTANPL